MKILIADDSVIIRERILEMLANFRSIELVGVCENGIDALEAIRTLNPDVAIVDLKMPGLTGLEVIGEIRKENKIIKFILLTFHSTDSYRQKAKEAGTDYFFSKSDEFEQLEILIEHLQRSEPE
ncbi:MAG: response regulator transcription factor [Prolixibacteraceae bacterium]